MCGNEKWLLSPVFGATAREEGWTSERMRSSEVGEVNREGRYKAHNAEIAARRLGRKSEEVIVAMKARTTQPAGAKDLCLSRADAGGGTA
jgi:hypothetical protein